MDEKNRNLVEIAKKKRYIALVEKLGRGSLSSKELKELEEFEGNRSLPYQDTNGLWTIGVGHCLTKSEISSGKIIVNGMTVKYAAGLTEQQIQCLLSQDLKLAASVS